MIFDSAIRKISILFFLTICAFGLAKAENTDSLCVGAESLNAYAVVQNSNAFNFAVFKCALKSRLLFCLKPVCIDLTE